MLGYIEKIRELAKAALTDKTVDMIIGFKKGTVPLMNEPCFLKNPEETSRLVWDSHCGINLVNYLTDRKEKIGIIAKGCDSRNIVTHIIENKIKREQLYIIGVPCKGMVDQRQIALLFPAEVEKAVEQEDMVLVSGKGQEKTVAKADVRCRQLDYSGD